MNSQLTSGYQRDRTIERLVEFYNEGNLDAVVKQATGYVKQNPEDYFVWNMLGVAWAQKGEMEEATFAFRQVVSIKPNISEVHSNIGALLAEQGKFDEAIDAFVEAMLIEPGNVGSLVNLAFALERRVFLAPNPKVQNAICKILDHGSLVRPKSLLVASQSLLKLEPQIKQLLKSYSKGNLKKHFKEGVMHLSGISLLLKIMGVSNLVDVQFEGMFTEIRSLILQNIDALNGDDRILRFQSALALQCFTNEFIYSYLDGDESSLQLLEHEVEISLKQGKQPSPQSILCLASFKPLVEFRWCDLLIVNENLEEVYKRQVVEPNREQTLKSIIPSLNRIRDEVSSKVREQYEERPFPRWVDLGLAADYLHENPGTIQHLVNALKLKTFDNNILDVYSPNILIGGCGTGQHSIEEASRFKNSKVLAVDLSLSSLSYARRKTEEFGKDNIEYIHADILDLDGLGKQFDIVESCGVLHHMNDPMAGWRVLTNRLKSGGLMKIALYSELARTDIVKIREEILLNDVGSSDCSMKKFRKDVIGSDKEHHQRILTLGDFFTLSELKDLLFHVQEHRFTIPQIQQCLLDLGLRFCGFEMDKFIVDDFKLRNPDGGAVYELDYWHAYEQENPNTFINMYQFWVQKVG